MKVAFGSDEYTPLTDAVRADLEARGHDVVVVDDGEWAAVGRDVGALVADGFAARSGVLFCWTGTGASIAANKVAGVRAALCTDAATAAGARHVERRQRAGDGPAPHQPRGRARDARRLVRDRPGPRRGRERRPPGAVVSRSRSG